MKKIHHRQQRSINLKRVMNISFQSFRNFHVCNAWHGLSRTTLMTLNSLIFKSHCYCNGHFWTLKLEAVLASKIYEKPCLTAIIIFISKSVNEEKDLSLSIGSTASSGYYQACHLKSAVLSSNYCECKVVLLRSYSSKDST